MNQNPLKKIGAILLSLTFLSSCSQKQKEEVSGSGFIQKFEKKTPLQLINIGDVDLAVRHHQGQGIPLVFIHGTLDDHGAWLPVVSKLSETISNPIILFDLRGHSASKLTNKEQGSINQDANDVVKLVQKLGYDRAHFIGHSYGANITIKLTNNYPEIASSIFLYEPPVFGLLFGRPKYEKGLKESIKSIMTSQSLLKDGKIEEGVQLFIENLAFGANSWQTELDDRTKATMLSNYETFLDQSKDEQRLNINVAELNNYNGDITIIQGSNSLGHFSACVSEIQQLLNNEKTKIIKGAKHNGVFTHAQEVSDIISEKIASNK